MPFGELRKDRGELFAQKDRDDGGRRLACAQAVIVARDGGGHPQQVGMVVHGRDDGAEHDQKLHVLIRVFPRIQQVCPIVGGKRPVVVLA